jgi:hypothetical protein
VKPDDDAEFMRFWQLYGRVGPRKKAWEFWQEARVKADPEQIIAGLERWVAYWRTPGASAVKWPQGWLREERWRDDPPTFLCRMQRPTNALEQAVGRARQARASNGPTVPARALNGSAAPVPQGVQRSIAAASKPVEATERPIQGRLL